MEPPGTRALVEVAVEPKSRADQERLAIALAKEPTFTKKSDAESGQTILIGDSERHLNKVLNALLTTYEVDANIGAPQVAYRETITQIVRVDQTSSRIVDSRGEFARVIITFEPGEPGSGFVFESKIGGAIPKEFIPGVEKGLESIKEGGLLAGFPLIDFKATLTDGTFHDVDSSVLAFEIAARAAFRALRDKGAPKLLEPIMKVEVLSPDDYLGDVISDLNSRRGQIQGSETRGNAQVVIASVRLANMLGYDAALQRLTESHASFVMTFLSYAPADLPVDDPDLFPPAAAMRA